MPGSPGAEGPTGRQGPVGPRGFAGLPGLPGPAVIIIFSSSNFIGLMTYLLLNILQGKTYSESDLRDICASVLRGKLLVVSKNASLLYSQSVSNNVNGRRLLLPVFESRSQLKLRVVT